MRIGYPITGYGQESRNRAARQRIPNRIWTDEDGVEHVEVNSFEHIVLSFAIQIYMHSSILSSVFVQNPSLSLSLSIYWIVNCYVWTRILICACMAECRSISMFVGPMELGKYTRRCSKTR